MKNEIQTAEKLIIDGKLSEAEKMLKDLLNRSPDDADVMTNMGFIKETQGEIQEAKNLFLKALKYDQTNLSALVNLSSIYQLEKKWDKSIPILKKCIQLDSQDYDLYNYLANAYINKKDHEKAKQALYHSNEIKPGQQFVKKANQYIDGDVTDISEIERQNDTRKEKFLVGKKIAIVNPWENKFTDLYLNYFKKNNDVKLIKPQSPEQLSQIFQWADLIWSQWCNEWLAALSKQNQFEGTLVTHIHSYEILTPYLMENVEWRRVDGILFVADHIRNNANQIWQKQIANVPQAVISNCIDKDEYPLCNSKKGYNIGYIGYINHKKGIGLLLQCIKAAVELDPKYRFHLASSFQEKRFEVYMYHLIEQMGVTDNVVFHGWVENISEWLRPINYIISTSPWEGCPLNLIEAMACGIKPLIHNWQGADKLFPTKSIFNTVSDFVTLLKEDTYDSKQYRNFVLNRFNAERNIPMIDTFLKSCVDRRLEYTQNSISQDNWVEKNDKIQPDENIKYNKSTQSSGVDFFQPLSRTIELSNNRKHFTVDFCRGKRVLHIGCVDAGMMDARIKENNFLHYQIDRVAKKLIGVDVEKPGIDRLKNEGFDVYKLNLETDSKRLKLFSTKVDVIVIPEVIEHLSNVGRALANIKRCEFKGEILISTPNAFSFRAYHNIANCIELVHPDHNCYYSPTTLKTLLSKNGFGIQRLVMYYWETGDQIGKKLKNIVTQFPYYAEGMIAVVKDAKFIA